MKTEDKITITRKPRDQRPTEAKPVVDPAWTSQPNPLTREEIRRIVIEQIG